MFLMFTLRRQNVLPVGDFGIRMAMYKNYLEKKAARAVAAKANSKKNGKAAKKASAKPVKIILPNPEQMAKIAKAWEPYRSIASWYLWRSLDMKTIG
jgi:3-methyladenine DNA glycosylase/8-oxoguanine DNA glycosylase